MCEEEKSKGKETRIGEYVAVNRSFAREKSRFTNWQRKRFRSNLTVNNRRGEKGRTRSEVNGAVAIVIHHIKEAVILRHESGCVRSIDQIKRIVDDFLRDSESVGFVNFTDNFIPNLKRRE